jgi:hypothetical protein
MKTSDNLTPNKWHPIPRNNVRIYPSPQSILRESVGADEYKFVSETVTTEHIRAAVIMPLDKPYLHLLNEPYSLVHVRPTWRMIIVSTLDPVKWLDLARATGAISWWRGHNMTVTYNWERPLTDDLGNKIRPPNALGVTKPPNALEATKSAVFTESGRRVRSDIGVPRGKYDLDNLLEDIRAGTMTWVDIGLKHNISRITAMNIGRQHGIKKMNLSGLKNGQT